VATLLKPEQDSIEAERKLRKVERMLAEVRDAIAKTETMLEGAERGIKAPQ
jgi:hypothetical protein